ncbi:Uncharacterised protein [Pandoraea pnomenusa]|uniref:Uncharacterized protein n=1 Tax=Pandoraea pnomenusa TaxID=93220 RepID=A0A379KEA3_9BURK|nr:hypothetical protein [Pandoraea pnomenusa]SUD65877.1 Uncharacterised protein [Pandoraea pnomenusa]
MSEQKNEQNFHSDIGQVAGESIVNHTNGPTQSNIITIHGAAPPEPPAPITELQRKAIGAKVAQIAERGGVEKIHVYRIILTHFGVNRIRELPKTDFHATMAFLDELEKGGDDASSEGDASRRGGWRVVRRSRCSGDSYPSSPLSGLYWVDGRTRIGRTSGTSGARLGGRRDVGVVRWCHWRCSGVLHRPHRSEGAFRT